MLTFGCVLGFDRVLAGRLRCRGMFLCENRDPNATKTATRIAVASLRFNSQAARNVVCTAVPALLLGSPAEDASNDGAGQVVCVTFECFACGL